MSSRFFQKDFNKIPSFNNHSPHTLQFELKDSFNEKRWSEIINISSVHKLNRYTDENSIPANSYFAYIISKFNEKN
jgi:hypothetical protein